MTWLDFLTDALTDMGVYAPGDPIDDTVMQYMQRWLNRIIDTWAGLHRYSYAQVFTAYTLTPGHQPTLLGPGLTSPDFATVGGIPRPPQLDGATLILNDSNPSTDLVLNIRDADWWNAQQVKGLTSSVPTDLYYQPDFPSGALFLWPIPTVGYGIRLETRQQISKVTDLTTTFVAPPTYEEALLLTVEESAGRGLSKPADADLIRRAREARAKLFNNTIHSPRMASADYGAGLSPRRDGFNWISGFPA